jgi:hypothetical protein
MGRPIKKRYFAGSAIMTTSSNQTVASVSVLTSGTHYSQGITLSLTGGAQTVDGVAAQISPVVGPSPTQGIRSVTVNVAGRGYYEEPTVVVNKPATVYQTTNHGNLGQNTLTVASTVGISIGMEISGGSTGVNGYITAINGNIITSTVNNTGTFTNAANLMFLDNGSGATFNVNLSVVPDTGKIAATAYIPLGTAARASAILKQESSNRYLCENSDGVGICKLVTTSTLSAGQMYLTATDINTSTYYIEKLTSRKAYLVQKTAGISGFVYSNNQVAKWTTGTATAGYVKVTLN